MTSIAQNRVICMHRSPEGNNDRAAHTRPSLRWGSCLVTFRGRCRLSPHDPYPPLGAQPDARCPVGGGAPDQLICRADESVSDTHGPFPECVADVFLGPTLASAGLPGCRHPPPMVA